MVSAGFAYRRSDSRIHLVRIGHDSLNSVAVIARHRMHPRRISLVELKGAFRAPCWNRSRARAASTPTNISTNSVPDIEVLMAADTVLSSEDVPRALSR